MGERRRANAGERCRPQSFLIGVLAIAAAGECCNIYPFVYRTQNFVNLENCAEHINNIHSTYIV